MADDQPPYQIITILAHDEAAVTYLAQSSGTSRYVALKVADTPDADAVMARYDDWKAALARVRHARISRLLDVGRAGDNRVYFASEYVAGSSIATVHARARWTAAERVEIIRQISDGLAAVHAEGLAHMSVCASRVKIAMNSGVQATLLGLGTSLVLDGAAPQPDLDAQRLAELSRFLGADAPA